MTTETEITNVDEWIDSLYQHDNEFSIEYAGKTLVFKKRFATKIAFQLKDKSESDQAFTLIAVLSVKPKFTKEQAEKLPQDLITKIMLNLEIDPDLIKKKRPSLQL